MTRRERTERTKLTDESYGDGGPPKRPTVIVSNKTGNGLTAGKEYPVVSHRAWLYVVLDDNGHERFFSMESSTHAHCTNYDPKDPPFARVFEEVDE